MTDIYHITHIRNLPNIIQEGGLWCDAESVRRNIQPVEIAYTEIKERRTRRNVTVPPGGVLAEYVPFYFCNRSPMLYTIHKGNVPAYRDGQENILHLVSSAEAVAQAGLPFVFSDGHAVVQISLFYNDLNRLNEVDWKVVESWSWHDRPSDYDRGRRKQAEFLAHQRFPWELIQHIGVHNATIRDQVAALLEHVNHKPIVTVQRKWYYD
ncbi:MAG: DUF4433 domain-containing protein [Anaerolineales bacterium]|nr:MAG: DUF4433 domain-containing protein [Anaerolineales bacterium]